MGIKAESTFVVSAPVDDAWRFLIDLARVVPCMPGTELTVARVDTDLTLSGSVAQYGRGAGIVNVLRLTPSAFAASVTVRPRLQAERAQDFTGMGWVGRPHDWPPDSHA